MKPRSIALRAKSRSSRQRGTQRKQKAIIEKVGVSELTTIQAKAREGSLTKEEVLQTLQEKLTDEEILALKAVVYNELY